MGPHKGLTLALQMVGVRNSKKLVYRVLEVAHRRAHDTFEDPPAATARPHISAHWEGGINTGLLVGKHDSPPRASATMDPIHVWRAVGAVRRGQHTNVAYMNRTNTGAYPSRWNARVQRVWVSWCGARGGIQQILTVAIQRLCMGTRVHWKVFTGYIGDLKGERGIRAVGLELGRYMAVLVTSDDQGIHDVPPPTFCPYHVGSFRGTPLPSAKGMGKAGRTSGNGKGHPS